MKKFITVTALLAVLALGSACTSSEPTSPDGNGNGNLVLNGATEVQCAQWATQYTDLLNQFTAALAYVDPTDPSQLAQVKATAKQAVTTGRILIDPNGCGRYLSAADRSEAEDLLSDLEDSADEL